VLKRSLKATASTSIGEAGAIDPWFNEIDADGQKISFVGDQCADYDRLVDVGDVIWIRSDHKRWEQAFARFNNVENCLASSLLHAGAMLCSRRSCCTTVEQCNGLKRAAAVRGGKW
jgi:hypothetical protein